MKTFILLLIGIMIIDIGIQGNLASFLGVFMIPGYLQET